MASIFTVSEWPFAKTLRGVSYAHQAGLPVQINTCFASWNARYLEEMVGLVRSLGAVFWEIFFLILLSPIILPDNHDKFSGIKPRSRLC